jgi:5'-nucleotidase
MSSAQIDTVVVVYTHNTNGVLENCDCPERSYGALEKRAALIDSLRNSNQNMLLLDTGDILDIRTNPLLHKYIVMAYDYVNYDCWTPGDQDFVEGLDFFFNKLMKMSAQMVTSNIRYENNIIGKPFAIKKFGNTRIGITGTIREDLHRFLDLASGKDIKFENQMSSLEPVVKELSEKSDYIILLSHSGIDRDRKIATMFPKIDLIIGGHSQTILNQPELVGSTFITQAGESGYRTGIFKIIFQNKKILSTASDMILLQRGMADDPSVLKMIQNYHQERLAK